MGQSSHAPPLSGRPTQARPSYSGAVDILGAATMAGSVAIRGYRSSMRPEQLEARVMLSASPSDPDATLAAYVAARHDSRPDAEFNLAITGTEVQYSPYGTPS